MTHILCTALSVSLLGGAVPSPNAMLSEGHTAIVAASSSIATLQEAN